MMITLRKDDTMENIRAWLVQKQTSGEIRFAGEHHHVMVYLADDLPHGECSLYADGVLVAQVIGMSLT